MCQAYGYVWLSPEDRGESAEHLAEQSGQRLASLCKARNWHWQGLQRDHSLQRQPQDRPVLKQILQRLNPEDYLLVDNLLHLGRRFYDVYALLQWFEQQKKGRILAVEQDLEMTPENMSTILETFAQFPQLESSTSKAVSATSEAQPRRSEISKHNGGACPFGYRVNSDNEYEVIDAEAAVVRRIYKQRARGHSLRQIVRDLSHQKIPTKRGGKWQPNTIKNIVENPFYMGIYQTHYANFENNHPAIISQELYYQLNAHLLHDDIGM